MKHAIFMYHSISSAAPDPNGICVSADRFAEQLETLRRKGFHGVSMRELLAGDNGGSKAKLVGLTFDDGYTDFLTTAVPILESVGFTGTVFAVASLLGGENTWDDEPRLNLMDAPALREAAQRGMEVGSHSLDHVHLKQLSADELVCELSESRAVLAAAVDGEVSGFCYPYGEADGGTARAARAAGYAYACATNEGDADDMWLLPRRYIGNRDGGARLRVKLALAGR
jgi:peptidoglycan/xylan/chitin deacetylase (PgdA/CDA1 family)